MKNNFVPKLLFIGLSVFILVLIVLTILSSFADASYNRHIKTVLAMNQTSTFENDPNYGGLVSGIRTGVDRDLDGIKYQEFECTDDGVYFNCTYGLGCFYLPTYESGTIRGLSGNFLFYLDHDSDTVVKLCGRADCPHDVDQCNAYVEHGMDVTYYDGHLYYTDICYGVGGVGQIYRMDLDGSNRVKVMDIACNTGRNYTTCISSKFTNGVMMIGLLYLDETDGSSGIDWFYCKLDGGILKMKSTTAASCWTDGEAFLHGSYTKDEYGDPVEWRLMQWDPDTDTEWVVNTISGVDDVNGIVYNTYWGEKCGLCHRDGKVYKINYPNTEMEVLFETGVNGTQADFYPDCIAVWEKSDYKSGKKGTLHFFNYQGEKLGQVLIDIPTDFDNIPTLGETRDRIFIRGCEMLTLPSYYIDKSEFGTGEITLHQLNYPDLKEVEREWLFTAEDKSVEIYDLYTPENYGKIK